MKDACVLSWKDTFDFILPGYINFISARSISQEITSILIDNNGTQKSDLNCLATNVFVVLSLALKSIFFPFYS